MIDLQDGAKRGFEYMSNALSNGCVIVLFSLLSFFSQISIELVLFSVILIGIILSYFWSKKTIGSNRWRWITLFILEGITLICCSFGCEWGYDVEHYIFTTVGEEDVIVARTGMCLCLLQIIITFLMWRTFRNNANQQPPKPPKREFCGDV